MSKTMAVLAVAALCAYAPAFAAMTASQDIVSAADLDATCKSADSGVCAAYIAGYAHGFYYGSVGTKAGFPACLLHDISGAEARSIVTQFMDKHREMAQQGAPSVVAEALLTAYPCADRR
jgi:Ssp1 endopeptidase immunity protein Rap1a